VRNDEEVTKI